MDNTNRSAKDSEGSEMRPVAPPEGPLIRSVSDTANWVAIDRAIESERPDALFLDPFARRLAGERGQQIADSKPLGRRGGWPIVTRTFTIDRMIREEVASGADMVINLAAGLDARPYRMDLPASLRWVEIDFPQTLSFKEEILQSEKPKCQLERIPLDLSNLPARSELFARLGRAAAKALVISEGLIVYLSPEEASQLARDLAAVPSFYSWILDMVTPALLRTFEKRMSENLKRVARFKFAPQEGPAFFVKFGWTLREADSLLRTAARIKRLPFYMVPLSWFPDSHGTDPSRPWGGVCHYSKP